MSVPRKVHKKSVGENPYAKFNQWYRGDISGLWMYSLKNMLKRA